MDGIFELLFFLGFLYWFFPEYVTGGFSRLNKLVDVLTRFVSDTYNGYTLNPSAHPEVNTDGLNIGNLKRLNKIKRAKENDNENLFAIKEDNVATTFPEKRIVNARTCYCIKATTVIDAPSSPDEQILKNIISYTPAQKKYNFLHSIFNHLSQVYQLKKYVYPQVEGKIIDDDRVQQAIKKMAFQQFQDIDSNEDEVYQELLRKNRRRAEKLLKDMRSKLSDFLLRFTSWVLYKLLPCFLKGVAVHPAHVEMLQEASKHNQPMIFLPLHRSHLDYILMSFILLNNDVRSPLVASGDNLRIPFFGTYWEMLMILVLTVHIIIIPLDIASRAVLLQPYIHESFEFNALMIFAESVSFVHVIIGCLTGYVDQKLSCVVLNPNKIVENYLKKSFWVDFYCCLPTNFLITKATTEINNERFKSIFIWRYCELIKLYRYANWYEYMKNVSDHFGISYVKFRIIVAIIAIFFYLHVMNCYNIFWTTWDHGMDRGIAKWLVAADIDDRSVSFLTVYLRFMYTTLLTVLNAGYSYDPISNEVLVFLSNLLIISRLLYFITIAYFLELAIIKNSPTAKYTDMITEVRDFIRHRKMPVFLEKRILAFYDIRFQGYYFQEEEIHNTVSGQLRQEIALNACKKLVESVTFFKNLPFPLMIRIVSCLQHEIFLTNDVIVKAAMRGDSMYFISTGTVAVYSKGGKEICHLEDGDYFGEICLVSKDSIRVATVVASEVCEVYRLDNKNFSKAILPYPELYNKMISVASVRKEMTSTIDEVQELQQKAKVG